MAPAAKLIPRIRILRGAEIALGPGKVDLLEAIQQTGSLVRAAQQLRMSYMRAWTLLKTMNNCFRGPLVELVRGGREGGRAELTATGKRVLELYRQMEAAGTAAMQPVWKELRRSLKRYT